jgi:hypothetical protein
MCSDYQMEPFQAQLTAPIMITTLHLRCLLVVPGATLTSPTSLHKASSGILPGGHDGSILSRIAL